MISILKDTLSDGWLWFRLTLVVVAVGIASVVSWQVRGAYAQDEVTNAVNKATEAIQAELTKERKLREGFQTLATEKLAKLQETVENITVKHTTITNNITKEIAANPQFYGQTLPEGGKAQWQATRNLIKETLSGAPPPDGSSAQQPFSLLPSLVPAVGLRP